MPGTVAVSAVLWAMTLLGTDTWWGFILIGHLVISVGFAFLFTPLFTAALSSVKPQYTEPRLRDCRLDPAGGGCGRRRVVHCADDVRPQLRCAAAGTPQVEALAAGIRAGFLCGAILSLFAIVAAMFVRKPEEQPGGHGFAAH